MTRARCPATMSLVSGCEPGDHPKVSGGPGPPPCPVPGARRPVPGARSGLDRRHARRDRADRVFAAIKLDAAGSPRSGGNERSDGPGTASIRYRFRLPGAAGRAATRTAPFASMRKRVLPWPLPNAVTRQAPGTGLARTCAEPPSFRRRPDSCGRNPIPRHSRLFGGSRMRARGAAVSRAPRSACGRRFAVARCTGVQSAGGPRAPAGPGAKEEKA
jgi:hypothetical protein